MSIKQLKKLAKQIAEQETIISTSADNIAIEHAKNKIIQLTGTADLELDDMVKLDALIQSFLSQKE